MKAADWLALTGVILAGVLVVPFFVAATIAEIFDGETRRVASFLIWAGAAGVSLTATIAHFRRSEWASIGLAASGGVMMLVPLALAIWQGWPEAVTFALPGLLVGVAGVLPDD